MARSKTVVEDSLVDDLMSQMNLLATSLTYDVPPNKLQWRARQVKLLSGRLERKVKQMREEVK